MLDQMSGGRLEIGFGRGSSPSELIYYGQDPDKSQQIYAEALELVVKGLTRAQPDLPRRVLPFRRRADGARAVPEAASADLVRGACARQRRAGGAQGPAGGQPRSAGRNLHRLRQLPGGLARRARRGGAAADGARAFHRGGARPMPRRSPSRGAPIRAGTRASPICAASITASTRIRGRPPSRRSPRSAKASRARPTRSRPLLRRQIAVTGSNYLVGQFVFGDLSLDEALGSIELFARRVMPQLAALVEAGAVPGRRRGWRRPAAAPGNPLDFRLLRVAFAASSPHIEAMVRGERYPA